MSSAFEVLEVGEGRGRLQFVVHVGGGGHRLDLVEHRLKLFVFGDDGLRGRLGDVRIGSEHDGDGLADEAHLLHRQDRLVVESRPVIRIGDDFDDILRGNARKTPGISRAALTSSDLIRPCATVLRKILAWSMPGSRIKWVYSARPVTFSRASRRGTERPI